MTGRPLGSNTTQWSNMNNIPLISVPKLSVFIGVRPYTPVFLWFCPYFGDLVQVQRVIELFDKQVNNALNVHN